MPGPFKQKKAGVGPLSSLPHQTVSSLSCLRRGVYLNRTVAEIASIASDGDCAKINQKSITLILLALIAVLLHYFAGPCSYMIWTD